LPYLVRLAGRGWRDAVAADPALAAGLTTRDGELTSREVAEAHGLPFTAA
jgi:alanine dehydrogenase